MLIPIRREPARRGSSLAALAVATALCVLALSVGAKFHHHEGLAEKRPACAVCKWQSGCDAEPAGASAAEIDFDPLVAAIDFDRFLVSFDSSRLPPGRAPPRSV
jgi:hypothetical protein